MLSSEIIKGLGTIELAFPVDQWRIDGLQVWPVARAMLMANAWNWSGREHQGARGSKWADRFARVKQLAGGGVGHLLRDPLARWPGFAECRVDAVLLSDGVSLVREPGGLYDRFCEPVAGIVRSLGGRAITLIPRPIPPPIIGVHAHMGLPLALAVLMRRRGDPAVRLPGFDEAMRMAADCGFRPVLASALTAYAIRIRAWSRLFDRVLKRTRPRIAFLTSYYEGYQFAFIASCRRLGIPVVDFQHGLLGDHHPSYSGWRRIPAGGWELFPDSIWCWTESDAQSVMAWAGSRSALVGGNPYLERYRAHADPEVAGQVEASRRIIPDARRRILISLQVQLDDDAYYRLLDAVADAAPREWGFLVRVHPGHRPGHALAIESRYARRGIRCDAVACSALPLYAVLQAADAHLTHCSSVVIEAAAFGVRSVVFDPQGVDVFPDQMRSGEAVFASTPEAIVAALAAQCQARADIGSQCAAAGRTLARARALVAGMLVASSRKAS